MNERMTAAEYRKEKGLPPPGEDADYLRRQTIVANRLGADISVKPQIRIPKKRTPNRTEQEWLVFCHHKFPDAKTLYEPFTLLIPSGRYTPDVVVVRDAEIVAIYEVKGAFIKSPASIRAFKEARAAFPFWRFIFAQKLKSGWTQTTE